jgi:general secretion pathway protein M
MMVNSTHSNPALLGALQARWSMLASRERTLLSMAVLVVALALVWLVLLAPALTTLRNATVQGKLLDAQLQRMQTLQTQARELQKQASLDTADALRALQQATKQTLGATAQINVVADRANVTLQGSSADAVAQWLAQARINARSVPLEARLTQQTTPNGVTWSGVFVMSLPQRP